MSLPRYPNYKDSGVEWLGKVPEHWDVSPLKAVATHNDDVLDETTSPDSEIFYVDISSVDPIDGITAKETMLFSAAPSRARRRVKHGDVIVSTVRTYLRAIARVRDPEENLVVSTGFAVIRPGMKLVADYLGYIVSASYFVEQVIARSTGVSYPAINASELVAIPVAIPPLPEQTQIAAFLDRETAKIDELVAEQRRLMELLKEKRQAVISHAVTRGLNPDVPLKPSGIEWLGDVPEHWDLKPIKYLGKIISGFAFKSGDFTPDGVRVLKIANIQTYAIDWTDDSYVPESFYQAHSSFSVSNGDVVFALTRPIISTGLKAAIADIGEELVLLNQRNAIFRPSATLNKHFIYHFLFSNSFRIDFENKIDATGQQPNISPIDIGEIRIPLPPIQEQAAIGMHLNAITYEFDTLTTETQRAIDLLQERRTALISAAVTGQIDVRGLVAA